MKFTNSAAILIAMIIAVMVAASDCSILRDMLLNRRSRDAADNDEEHNVGSGVMDVFGAFVEDVGLKSVFRDVQMRMLGASEALLEQSTNIYDNFQDTLAKTRSGHDERASEFRKALRYLQTEARRRREDLEDEIEVEKEKAAEAETPEEKKESGRKLKKLNAALKQMDEVAKTRISSIRDRIQRRHSNRKSILKNLRKPSTEDAEKEVEKESVKSEKEEVDDETSRPKRDAKDKKKKKKSSSSSSSTTARPSSQSSKRKNKTKEINADGVQSAGDGFGDH
uniref:Myb-like protein V isoform X1 n=1 Tax=Dermatophagoides pteronyssinus TaxID=6956 RepID=A0A6P6YKF9_DERPT|nr:myb-like protein V isoform X1 [Dermatophagoides pteronyssinus]